jgi:hypothetical protein
VKNQWKGRECIQSGTKQKAEERCRKKQDVRINNRKMREK